MLRWAFIPTAAAAARGAARESPGRALRLAGAGNQRTFAGTRRPSRRTLIAQRNGLVHKISCKHPKKIYLRFLILPWLEYPWMTAPSQIHMHVAIASRVKAKARRHTLLMPNSLWRKSQIHPSTTPHFSTKPLRKPPLRPLQMLVTKTLKNGIHISHFVTQNFSINPSDLTSNPSPPIRRARTTPAAPKAFISLDPIRE
jgi:hypothetical protein